MFSLPVILMLAGAGWLGWYFHKKHQEKQVIAEAEKKEFLVTAAVGIGVIWFFPGAALFVIGAIILMMFVGC